MKAKKRLFIDVVYHRNRCNMSLNHKVSNKNKKYRMEC